MKLDLKLAEALTALRGNRDFETVMQGMAEHEAEVTQCCVNYDDNNLYRSQGAVKVLQLWQELFRDAPTILEKLRSTKSK